MDISPTESGLPPAQEINGSNQVNRAEQIVLEVEKTKAPWWQAAKTYLKYLGELALVSWAALDDPTEDPDFITSSLDVAAEKKRKLLKNFKERYETDYPMRELSPKDTGVIFIWMGIGTKPVTYQEQAEYFRSRGFTCHCVEWPKFDRNSFNFEQHPEYMVTKMKELGIPEEEKVTMIGHSRGGLALLLFAEKYPQKLNCAIVSSAPAGFGPDQVPKSLIKLINTVNSLPGEKLQVLFGKLAPYLGPNEWAAFVSGNDPHELTDCYLGHIERSWLSAVRAIPDSLRMAFTFGGKDLIVPIVGDKAVRAKKDSVRVVYPDKGHPLPPGEDLFRLLGWCLKGKTRKP